MVRFSEPLRHDTAERPVETGELPLVKRLDGEVTRSGELPLAGGSYCEVWIGLWDKGGGKEVRREKVGLGFTASILLTLPLQVALKAPRLSTSSLQSRMVRPCGPSPRCLLMFPSTIKRSKAVRKVCPCGPSPHRLLTFPSMIIRGLRLNCHVVQRCIIKTSCRSMVCIFSNSSPERLSWSDRDSHKSWPTTLYGECAVTHERTRY